jgi:hypothetical protein
MVLAFFRQSWSKCSNQQEWRTDVAREELVNLRSDLRCTGRIATAHDHLGPVTGEWKSNGLADPRR